MPPPTLSHGLNLSKAPRKPTGPPKAKKPLAAFSAGDSDNESDSDQGGAFASKSAKSGSKNNKSKPGVKPKPGSDVRKVNAQLATFDELSRKAAEAAAAAAAEVDPSIFDYDAAWEDMKAVERHKKAIDEVEAAERKPKYMENLLASAEIRKRDQLRAKEKMLQREREAEGEEFKDKESFVTEAYKKQQEELLRLEEEERIREENLRKKSQGMSSFHRNMLNKMESKHDLVVAAAERKIALPKLDSSTASPPPESDLERRARELRERGAAIDVNEEGQVVDKTQLLSGGLNVVSSGPKKPGASSGSQHAPPDIRKQQGGFQGKSKRQIEEERRARQTRMLEEQLAQAQKREAEEEVEKMRDLERQAKSRKTEKDVMSAKERYLARKRAAEEAKKRGESPP